MDPIHYHQSLNVVIKKHLAKDQSKHKSITGFLKSVNDLCYTFENEKEHLKSQIRPNERKYVEINTRLKKKVEQRRESVNKLMEAIGKLDLPAKYQMPNFNEDNLYEIAVFMKKILVYQKGIEIQLRKAKEEADRASNAKSEFLSMMSHEIRTPLNGIVAMTYLMQQEPQTPEMSENLKILNFSTENLYSLINDILDFNKIEAGKIILESIHFNIKELVTNIKKTFQLNASSKNINLVLNFDNNIPENLIGDPLRISQILNNLVNNAVKFTNEGSIYLKLKLNKIENNHVEVDVSVEDTGIGIAEEHIPFIFEKFRQADNQISRRFGGTGLGLGITKKLLELFGSKINVESNLNQGSKFYFTLSLEMAKQNIKTISNSENIDLDQQTLKGTKVLLVEDFPVNIKIATIFLEKWGMKYDTAENGKIAVEKVLNNDYQIVLMDLLMPEMDGYTATENIRKFDTKIPIIALTASALNTQDRVYEVGMNDFVTKPFNPKELFQKINKHYLRA